MGDNASKQKQNGQETDQTENASKGNVVDQSGEQKKQPHKDKDGNNDVNQELIGSDTLHNSENSGLQKTSHTGGNIKMDDCTSREAVTDPRQGVSDKGDPSYNAQIKGLESPDSGNTGGKSDEELESTESPDSDKIGIKTVEDMDNPKSPDSKNSESRSGEEMESAVLVYAEGPDRKMTKETDDPESPESGDETDSSESSGSSDGEESKHTQEVESPDSPDPEVVKEELESPMSPEAEDPPSIDTQRDIPSSPQTHDEEQMEVEEMMQNEGETDEKETDKQERDKQKTDEQKTDEQDTDEEEINDVIKEKDDRLSKKDDEEGEEKNVVEDEDRNSKDDEAGPSSVGDGECEGNENVRNKVQNENIEYKEKDIDDKNGSEKISVTREEESMEEEGVVNGEEGMEGGRVVNEEEGMEGGGMGSEDEGMEGKRQVEEDTPQIEEGEERQEEEKEYGKEKEDTTGPDNKEMDKEEPDKETMGDLEEPMAIVEDKMAEQKSGKEYAKDSKDTEQESGGKDAEEVGVTEQEGSRKNAKKEGVTEKKSDEKDVVEGGITEQESGGTNAEYTKEGGQTEKKECQQADKDLDETMDENKEDSDKSDKLESLDKNTGEATIIEAKAGKTGTGGKEHDKVDSESDKKDKDLDNIVKEPDKETEPDNIGKETDKIVKECDVEQVAKKSFSEEKIGDKVSDRKSDTEGQYAKTGDSGDKEKAGAGGKVETDQGEDAERVVKKEDEVVHYNVNDSKIILTLCSPVKIQVVKIENMVENGKERLTRQEKKDMEILEKAKLAIERGDMVVNLEEENSDYPEKYVKPKENKNKRKEVKGKVSAERNKCAKKPTKVPVQLVKAGARKVTKAKLAVGQISNIKEPRLRTRAKIVPAEVAPVSKFRKNHSRKPPKMKVSAQLETDYSEDEDTFEVEIPTIEDSDDELTPRQTRQAKRTTPRSSGHKRAAPSSSSRLSRTTPKSVAPKPKAPVRTATKPPNRKF